MNMREATLNGSILRVAYFCKVKKVCFVLQGGCYISYANIR